MEKRTKIIVITVSIVTLVSLAIGYLFFRQTQNGPEIVDGSTITSIPKRSNEEITKAILQQSPELGSNDVPSFTIGSTKRMQERWYVVTLYLRSDAEKTNPAKMLLYDLPTTGELEVYLGPGTLFPDEQLQEYDVPKPVGEELNK